MKIIRNKKYQLMVNERLVLQRQVERLNERIKTMMGQQQSYVEYINMQQSTIEEHEKTIEELKKKNKSLVCRIGGMSKRKKETKCS